MDFRLLIGIILSFLPISELRGGIPFAIPYAIDHQIPIIIVFSLIVLVNILGFFFAFLFLDNAHHLFLRNKFYNKIFEKYALKLQKKADKFEKSYKNLGFIALMIFVAVPLPGTGAWTGALISWFLGLDRKKSLVYISLGVLIAGVIMLLGTLGVIKVFS
ncbi:MAG: small multi-drug export protein [Nanoarchaeota archaeon]|nr:small multi-drug export protein [Nanoarchaeota archaeon]